jgi:two-component system response regulator RegA
MQKTILLVDDENFFRDRLRRAFANRGFTVFEAAGYHEAMALIEEQLPDMAVVDLRMPGKSGLEVVKEAKKNHPDIAIVVLTGYGSIATATEAIRLGADSYLPKPADVDDILRAFSGGAAELETIASDNDFETPSLARAEWEHINRVLADCNGNISEAAKRLGLHRRTLQRKLYKYAPDK